MALLLPNKRECLDNSQCNSATTLRPSGTQTKQFLENMSHKINV